MKRILIIFSLSIFILSCNPDEYKDEFKPTNYVDNFYGIGEGNVLPGAFLPFSLVRLSPNVKPPHKTNGYKKGKPIGGFSHLHTSGTGGGPRYGNILVIPQVGDINFEDFYALKQKNEYAKPGYYTVLLQRKSGDVKCELTVSEHVGFHKYMFYDWSKNAEINANILIDVEHVLTRNRGTDDDGICIDGNVEIVKDNAIKGFGEYIGGWGGINPYKVYFYAVFDTKFDTAGVWQDSLMSKVSDIDNTKLKAYARFKIKQKQSVQVKVGISLLSTKKAKENLKEIPHWNFAKARKNADNIWNHYLSKIKVEGGTPEQRTIFYSSLKNTFIMPTDVTGENPHWDPQHPHYWDHYCLWDVFRTVMPLHTLIVPDRQVEIINSLIDVYNNKGWLPDAWTAGDYAMVQGGSNADIVIADAVVKGLEGFDLAKAYEAMKKNAEQTSDSSEVYGRELTEFFKYGYCSNNTKRAVSRTLEYAYNDFCIAQVAQKMQNEEDYTKYIERSLACFNLFNNDEGLFLAKDPSGNWIEKSKPIYKQPTHYSNAPYFYEGNAYTYSTFAPHDVQGLINRHGGKQNFVDFLDFMFDSVGFNLGNEPLFLVPYMYNYAGRPDKTAIRVRDIIEKQYQVGDDGIPGQDDSGAMSAWYVFSGIGIFPVAGQDVYLIGSPVFEKTTINLGNGKTFKITTTNYSPENIYVQSVRLNSANHDQPWIKHEDIIKGGELNIKMSNQPSDWGTKNFPPSISK